MTKDQDRETHENLPVKKKEVNQLHPRTELSQEISMAIVLPVNFVLAVIASFATLT